MSGSRGEAGGYSAFTTSITNHSVEFGGILAPLPWAPYAKAGGICSRTRLPTLMPVRPVFQPGISPLSGWVNGGR